VKLSHVQIHVLPFNVAIRVIYRFVFISSGGVSLEITANTSLCHSGCEQLLLAAKARWRYLLPCQQVVPD